MTDTDWSARALAYFRSHAISPAIASECGVTERDGALCYPNVGEDGAPFERVRSLEGGGTRQPPRVPLTPWWPGGKLSHAVAALVTEGESDALAALTAIRHSRSRLLGNISVLAAPGAGFSATKLAAHLRARGISNVWLAFDADDPGGEASERARRGLAKEGIAARELLLPQGSDLADVLAATADPARWLTAGLMSSDPSSADSQADRERELLRKAGSMKRVGFVSEAIITAIAAENRAGQPVLHPTALAELERSVAGWRDAAPLWLTDPVEFIADARLGGDERLLLLFLVQRLRADGTRYIGIRRLSEQLRWTRGRVIKAKSGLVYHGRLEWTHGGGRRPGKFRVLRFCPGAEVADRVPGVGTELPERLEERTESSSPRRPGSSVPGAGTQKAAA